MDERLENFKREFPGLLKPGEEKQPLSVEIASVVGLQDEYGRVLPAYVCKALLGLRLTAREARGEEAGNRESKYTYIVPVRQILELISKKDKRAYSYFERYFNIEDDIIFDKAAINLID